GATVSPELAGRLAGLSQIAGDAGPPRGRAPGPAPAGRGGPGAAGPARGRGGAASRARRRPGGAEHARGAAAAAHAALVLLAARRRGARSRVDRAGEAAVGRARALASRDIPV